MNCKTYDDDMTRLIVERLGERQRMVNRMRQLEQKPKLKKIYLHSALLVAACLTLALMVMPWQRTQNPLDTLNINIETEGFRSASTEIDDIVNLMNEGRYEEAQTQIELSLQQSEDCLDMMGGCEFDEEMEFMELEERQHNKELRWLYACILTRTEQYPAATKQLRKYLKGRDECPHEQEARELLQELKKMK